MADTDPTANDRIISSLFESELHRSATDADLDYWGNQMKVNSQTNPETMKAAFAASYAKDNPNTNTNDVLEGNTTGGTTNTETKATINELIKKYYNRNAYAGDYAFWGPVLESKGKASVEAQYKADPKNYNNTLRAVQTGNDTTTTTNTNNVLEGNTTTTKSDDDYKKIINDMFKKHMKADATQLDYDTWLPLVKAQNGSQTYLDTMGKSMDELYLRTHPGEGTTTTTKSDDDYKKIINDMFKTHMKADATQLDYDTWLPLVKAQNGSQAYIDQMGASMDELYKKQQAGGGTTTTLTDDDYKKMIDRQIQAKLGRPAVQADYDLWLPTLKSGQYTETTLGDLYAGSKGLKGFKNDPIDYEKMTDAEKTRRYSPVTETMFKPTGVDFNKLTTQAVPMGAVMGNPWAAGTASNGTAIPSIGTAPTYGVYTGTNKPATVTKSIGDLIESITPKTETATTGTAGNTATLNSGIAGLNPALNLDPNKTLNLNQIP